MTSAQEGKGARAAAGRARSPPGKKKTAAPLVRKDVPPPVRWVLSDGKAFSLPAAGPCSWTHMVGATCAVAVPLATLRQQQCYRHPKTIRSCGVPSLCSCSFTLVPLHWSAQPDAPSILLVSVEHSVRKRIWQSAMHLFVLAKHIASVQVQALPAAADGPGRAPAGCLIPGPSSRGSREPASIHPAGATGRHARLRPPGSGVRGSAREHQDTLDACLSWQSGAGTGWLGCLARLCGVAQSCRSIWHMKCHSSWTVRR